MYIRPGYTYIRSIYIRIYGPYIHIYGPYIQIYSPYIRIEGPYIRIYGVNTYTVIDNHIRTSQPYAFIHSGTHRRLEFVSVSTTLREWRTLSSTHAHMRETRRGQLISELTSEHVLSS
jgi:hypothetical protein